MLKEIMELAFTALGNLENEKEEKRSRFQFVNEDEDKIVLRFPVKDCKVEQEEKEEKESENGIVYFTDEEIKSMPKKIQKLIILEGKRCRIRTRKSGENSTTYEVRFRREGYDVSACGVTIEIAKKNFIEKIKTASKKETSVDIVPKTFDSFAHYYFEHFRKEKVSAQTMKTDMQRYDKYLKSALKETPIIKITPSNCKKILDEVKYQGKFKTEEELYGLLSVIFKSAIAHGIIERSPLATIQHTSHERKSGTALTREEEDLLFKTITEHSFLTATALALYCGLRPNEIKTAKIEGKFIVAVNSKRKGKKVEYKKIPIIKRLIPFIKNGISNLPTPKLLRRRISEALPNHKLYDLRTTFYSRCKEFGVSDHALNEYVGHSLGALGNAYTDLSDEYLLKEGKKLDVW